MGEITAINHTGGKNYFAQIEDDSDNSDDSNDSNLVKETEQKIKELVIEPKDEEIKEVKKEKKIDVNDLIQPSIKDEQKKFIKLKMKRGKKGRRGKGKGKKKYEDQFEKQEGNLFKGKIQ